jgi:hypothetical protein
MPTQYIDPTGTATAEATGTPSLTVVELDPFKRTIASDVSDVFLNTGEFGEVATYEFADGHVQTLDGIYDEEASSVDIGTETEVIQTGPQFVADSDKFEHKPGKSDSVIIRNRTFVVKEVHPDGTGVTVLTLLDR